MKSLNGDKFIYCKYWQNWSRVLRLKGRYFGQVEVTLTPINSHSDYAWKEKSFLNINIRQHLTDTKDDIIVDDLPDSVYDDMVSRIGKELTDRLIHEDFLPNIDFEKYRSLCNGGAPFNLIRKIK